MLYALTKDPREVRITDLGPDVLLTDQGRYIQRHIAVIHTREITDTMTEHLCVEELLQLRDLCTKLIQQCPPTGP